MSTPPPLPDDQPPFERPDGVWLIFILYWLGFVITVGSMVLVGLAYVLGNPVPLDPVDMGVSLIALLIRGVGTMKLFFLQADAWVYFGGSFCITTMLGIANVIGKALTHQPVTGIYEIILAGAVWTWVTVYAYRVGNGKLSI